MFEATGRAHRSALLPFMTAGLPDPDHGVDVFEAMAEAGADGFEVGIPYSDPLMDGPVIQEASRRSLEEGMSVAGAIDLIAEVVERTSRPVLAMTYVNPVLAVGPAEFSRRLAAAGAAGVIVADLPVDESGPIQVAVEAAGLGMVLFVAPTTGDDRLQRVVEAHPAMVYAVADLGVTGERRRGPGRLASLAQRVRRLTSIPIAAGVGIGTPEQARQAARSADGIIVGSAVVGPVLDAPDPVAAIESSARAVRRLSAALAGD